MLCCCLFFVLLLCFVSLPVFVCCYWGTTWCYVGATLFLAGSTSVRHCTVISYCAVLPLLVYILLTKRHRSVGLHVPAFRATCHPVRSRLPAAAAPNNYFACVVGCSVVTCALPTVFGAGACCPFYNWNVMLDR